MMALFNEAFVQQMDGIVRRHYQTLGVALGEPTTTVELDAGSAQSPLHRDLELLMQVANGEYQRAHATPAMLQRVEDALKNFMALLFGNALHTYVNIPDDFWHEDAGILVSRVRWWLSADELITISNAAALAFGENTQANRMRIARAMERGLLAWIPDPSVANPQQNRRVLRSQVDRLREQSRLPE
jgi:hypothetical protein